MHLARVHAKAEVLKLMNWRIAWGVGQGPQPGRRFRDEGLRHRVHHRGLSAAAWRSWAPNAVVRDGSPGAILAGTHRAHVPRLADPHLRRRDERGAARHHRDGRPRPARGRRVADGLVLHRRTGAARRADAQILDATSHRGTHARDRAEPTTASTLHAAGRRRNPRRRWPRIGLEKCRVLVEVGRPSRRVPFADVGRRRDGRAGSAAAADEMVAPAISCEEIDADALVRRRPPIARARWC